MNVQWEEPKRYDIEVLNSSYSPLTQRTVAKIDPMKINFDLTIHLIKFIDSLAKDDGSILILLPGTLKYVQWKRC